VFVDFCGCDVGPFRVLAWTPFYGEFVDVTAGLKYKGGPCGDRVPDYAWFVLPGPDRTEPQELHEAIICIVFENGVHDAQVGYHAAEECVPRTPEINLNGDACVPPLPVLDAVDSTCE